MSAAYGIIVAITPLTLTSSATVAAIVAASERSPPTPMAKNASSDSVVSALNSTSVRTLLQRWYIDTTNAIPGSASSADLPTTRLQPSAPTPTSTRLHVSHRQQPPV